MKHLISPEYLDLCERMHAQAPWGTKGFKYFGEIEAFAKAIGAQSILDYGCGQATLEKAFAINHPNIVFQSYDPCGAQEYRDPPRSAQLVTATDVLEHIEPDKLDAVLDHIADLSHLGAFFIIPIKPAYRNLPDGRNAHLTVQDIDWWIDRLRRRLRKRFAFDYERHKSLHIKALRRELHFVGWI